MAFPCSFSQALDGGTPNPEGLPVGLQVIGPQWGEQKIFNVGYAFQQATDWHKKRPNI
jgi:aspartyl-tRNA(Asn)/glutamyl-tRNA(Gln) amidotransferase subunit A